MTSEFAGNHLSFDPSFSLVIDDSPGDFNLQIRMSKRSFVASPQVDAVYHPETIFAFRARRSGINNETSLRKGTGETLARDIGGVKRVVVIPRSRQGIVDGFARRLGRHPVECFIRPPCESSPPARKWVVQLSGGTLAAKFARKIATSVP